MRLASHIDRLLRVRFQSTHPRGVRHGDRACLGRSLDFNPRTHVGCDGPYLPARTPRANFNPRTHVGCDIEVRQLHPVGDISIHAPTWGATIGRSFDQFKQSISIHAPTWGATQLLLLNSTPTRHFNPRTHVGCDEIYDRLWKRIAISIHAPTWGATGRICASGI